MGRLARNVGESGDVASLIGRRRDGLHTAWISRLARVERIDETGVLRDLDGRGGAI